MAALLTVNSLLVGAIAVQRLVELGISARARRRLLDRGVGAAADPCYPYMVGTHVLLLLGTALEPWLLARPFLPLVGWPALAGLAAAQVLRAWVLRSLGGHWNVRILRSAELGFVTAGPYRFVRHPNYAVVIAETVLLPLFHGAWWTLALVQVVHLPVLAQRIRCEERYLFSIPGYREAFARKPRFLPRP
jgi:methyltransferase